MANTPDYTNQASSYKQKFLSQGRTNDFASVTSNDLMDRDNLLHFLEDKFKTNVRGGVKVEDLRAFLHMLVKSVPVLNDDKSFGVLMNMSFRISTSAANRWYYGSQTYGWGATTWSQYSTATINSSNIPAVSGFYNNMGVDVPFDLFNFTIFGTVMNQGSTGDVDIHVFYFDNDDSSNSNLQNGVHVATVPTIDCAVLGTGYGFETTTTVKIPKGKKIFAFIQNRGWTSGTETLRITMGYRYSRYSPNFT